MPNEHTIAENLQRLIDAKTAIGNAITAKGGTVGQNDGLEEFAAAINGISTGVDTSNDTVTAATLKSGYTAHNAAGQQITGTMLSQPTTATAETIKEGFTAYNSDGELITGAAPFTSWEQLQQKVRANDMSDISIGDQFTCGYGQSTLTWDVIGKNQDIPNDPKYTYSLTLRLHDQLPDPMQFDDPEAFYYCSSQLSAGNYYIKAGDSNREFTLTQSVPAGGQLVFLNNSTSQVATYSSATSTTAIETVSTSSGKSGTSLGTLQDHIKSGNLNTYFRALYGNNNWQESGFRQWLNSNQTAGQWWTPKNIWDRPPTYASTLNGFLYDLDPEFVEVLGLTNKVTTYCSTDGTGTYTTADLMFLLSRTEVYGGDAQSGYPEGQAYTFYSEGSSLSAPGTGADTNRITYRGGTASKYWLRTPSSSSSHSVYRVNSGGSIDSGTAFYTHGVVPACCII